MISPQARVHGERLRERRESPPPPPEGLDDLSVARLANDLFESWAAPAPVEITESDAGTVPVLWVDHDSADQDRVLLYFHGGGYILGSARHVAKMVGHIAVGAGCRAVSVDYRLAPEHPFPAAVDDAVTAYEWLLDTGVRPGNVAVGGDSAGGGLTLALLLALRNRGLPQPAGAVPISPWADLACEAATWVSNADTDMLLEKDRLAGIAQLYLQGADPTDPLASPGLGDYTGLAPLYVQASGHETLLDDCLVVVGAAARAGVDVRLDVFPEMQHVFQYCVGVMPEADDAVARIANWIRIRTGG